MDIQTWLSYGFAVGVPLWLIVEAVLIRDPAEPSKTPAKAAALERPRVLDRRPA